MVIVVIGIILGCVAIFAIATLVLWIFDRIQLPSRSREAREQEHRRFLSRLRNPDLAALEQHFGHALPAAIKALYENQQELDREEFEVAPLGNADGSERWYLAWYEPADMETVNNQWPQTESYFAFANDGCGNTYMVDPRLPDPAVFFYDHEGGDVTKVCDSISEFMNWPRLTTQTHPGLHPPQ